ncbi:uncharacterized protein LOC142330934 [Lycorma delicatula]|uniref:uncharacterized protein LOC142330934 n=1 Tax=Lycorma delicatula TaxID=130591 RepID=UPI003F51A840
MASNGITTRRNACQMFGIYRSRTPEKMELKPNKQTRACFLTAVITGVTLVVGLSLLDVSTNASNTKLAPVLQLKRHRQDILFENNTNINVDNISIFNGIVKEVTKIPVEKTTYTINTATTMGTTTTSTQSDLKADISQRTARTQLFPVESLKMNRNSIVKDYFIDGRHDPKSLGYYILQKQNGEYYLRNHSEPVWGTRIQRRFSNRIYPTQPDYDTTVNDENQLPPYQFTPIPLFSNSYAQLDPYKNNANVKSVQDVMKYLTVPPKISRSSTTSMPRMVRTESTFIETTVKPENISNPSNNNNKKRKKGIRFSGTYQMPIEPEDLKTGGSGLIETLLPPPIPTPFAKPYSGNIGTLINDPFAKFRPSDPAEINHQLSPISSVLKNTSNKQKEIGSMFRNNIATSTIPPNRFFPKPPFGTRKRPRPVNTNVTPSTTNNGHNVAVYKPVPQNDNMYYKENNNNNYGTPSLNMRPPHQNIKRKRKPVSVTLDIYPITMDYDQDNSPSDNKNNVKNPSIGKFKNGDSELEWISPTMLSNDDQDSDDTSSSNNDSHMVVHLNLFPKGITRKQRSRTGRRPVWNNSETPRSMFTQKSVVALRKLMEFAIGISGKE